MRLPTKSRFDKLVRLAAENDSFEIVESDPQTFGAIIQTDDGKINSVIKLLADLPITDFGHLKETLEDYFMSYYKEDRNYGGALK